MLPDFDLLVQFDEDPIDMEIDIRPVGDLAPIPDLSPAENPARVYMAGLSPGSRPTMRASLDLSARVLTFDRCDHNNCPWWLLRIGHVKALKSWLSSNRHYKTANKTLSAVRGTLRAAWDMNQIDTDSYMRAVSVRDIRGSRPPQAAGRALSHGEKLAILKACELDPTPAGPRDAAIFGLGVYGGLRRQEIADLLLEHYDAHDQAVTVYGKGNKVRIVHVASGVDAALADWLHERGSWSGPLFAPVNNGGKVQRGAGISDAAIYLVMVKRGEQAGVQFFSPHDLRRSFAGDLLDAGADLATVQKLMGHANANTTAGYDRRGERAKRAAIGLLHMAYERRY